MKINTVEWNKAVWDQPNWDRGGEGWSDWWGTVEMQWFRTLLPRIHPFVPTGTILEIAPGHGRWTHWLKDLCDHLVLVDLSPTCIEKCRARFSGETHISYHVTDGKSLSMVDDNSVDFVFTFDSLVHAERDVMEAYMREVARKLKPDGVAWVHHSNLGEYRRLASLIRSLRRVRGGSRLLTLSRVDNVLGGCRAPAMTAAALERYAGAAGLQCVSQELINWGTRRLTDCISVVTPVGSRWCRPNEVYRNGRFMAEAAAALRMSRLYRTTSPRGTGTPACSASSSAPAAAAV